ncbi:MAG: hypothetical protein JJ908_05830 [Rhizobiales bacterium]|nr:hypothetical protein [Hyphomicrobiales bacterium]MBO6697875.1 hypothetical protein [Hyphomicrobiales bacterium]MBO6735871.1 hypothetical protein [Hyphomicrobiales bacterium]MBO6913882.1 hypothetical protein [Hyphomicrobiales bacterium]MBO6955585.1 hypothetical protein [Hyphomicrobiales bacterium]
MPFPVFAAQGGGRIHCCAAAPMIPRQCLVFQKLLLIPSAQVAGAAGFEPATYGFGDRDILVQNIVFICFLAMYSIVVQVFVQSFVVVSTLLIAQFHAL